VQDDRMIAAVVYVMYGLSLMSGITALVGVILAHLNQPSPNPLMESHYRFQIRTFWLGLAALGACALLIAVGSVLSIILVGIPILLAGILVASGLWVWFCLRTIVGAVYLYRREPYPRPEAWII